MDTEKKTWSSAALAIFKTNYQRYVEECRDAWISIYCYDDWLAEEEGLIAEELSEQYESYDQWRRIHVYRRGTTKEQMVWAAFSRGLTPTHIVGTSVYESKKEAQKERARCNKHWKGRDG